MKVTKKLQQKMKDIVRPKDVQDIVEEELKSRTQKQWLIITLIVTVFVIAVLILATVVIYEIKYQNKFFPGTKISNINLEGSTVYEAIDLMDNITSQIEEEEIKLTYKNGDNLQVKITPAINSLSDPDLSRELLRFDNVKTINGIYAIGRNGNILDNFLDRARLLFSPPEFTASVTLDKSMMRILIHQELSDLENIAQNARPEITWKNNVYKIELLPAQKGIAIDYDNAIAQAENNLGQLKNNIIEVASYSDNPSISINEIKNKTDLIDQVLATTTPTLTYDKKEWDMSKYDLSQMLAFQHDDNKKITLGLDYNLFSDWIDKNISDTLNVEPKDASIDVVDGRVTNFEAHRNGRAINVEKTYQTINDQLLAGNIVVEVVVDTTTPSITTKDVNDLGISQLLGTGHSNFAGSPSNRRHNIRTGANSLHGVLVKPEDEFSLVDVLGDIDGENGYLQELVIKGDQTIPEYGGGLCQIGTTIFRATMDTGLPVTARRNHSYSVSYYLENGLPGTDATIYDPYPDYKFKNDTGNYILIQSRIEGNDLYFDIWGTSDGRIADRTVPKVWGWIDPPPTKYIETLDLPVGVTKCTESAHKGVSASFDYIITYPDGQADETTFNSRYKPWQAVCLIGVEKLSTPDLPAQTGDDTATSTIETVN
jgi:vancomycin resistance protein YoaR